MGIISHILNQDGKIVTTTKDKHGDQVKTSEASVKCKFRYITQVDKNVSREGLDSSDAIIWFEPTENVIEGSIIKVDDSYWRVDKLVKARRLSGNTVEFLKAFVKKHSLVV